MNIFFRHATWNPPRFLSVIWSGFSDPLFEFHYIVTFHLLQICLCSGADLAALVREACMAALRECINVRSTCHVSIENQLPLEQSPLGVGQRHFSAAFQKVKPSVSKKVGIFKNTRLLRNTRCVTNADCRPADCYQYQYWELTLNRLTGVPVPQICICRIPRNAPPLKRHSRKAWMRLVE